jgi:hypothetical protein
VQSAVNGAPGEYRFRRSICSRVGFVGAFLWSTSDQARFAAHQSAYNLL